jgi:hypothetical protein
MGLELVDRAIDAAGGRRRWAELSELGAEVRSGGVLMASKLKRRSFERYRLTVSTRQSRAILAPYPRPGSRGMFMGEAVRIESDDGRVLGEREGAREAFLGIRGRARHAVWWDHLDALYFAGYAMWNYLNTPFLFDRPELELSEGEPLESGGGRWRRLDATFPPGFPTHSREQSFYFDERGLLRRHDYSPDVVAPFANAAHLCLQHRTFGGLTLPTRRRVVPKGPGGRPLPGPVVVWIELDAVTAS